jgi:hypothetical protein
MASLRLGATGAVLLCLAAGMAGCPVMQVPVDDAASLTDPAPTGSADVGGEAGESGAKTSALEELAQEIASGEEGQELARSHGWTSISIAPDYWPEGVYPPGSSPYDDEGESSGDADEGNAGYTAGGASGSQGGGRFGGTYAGTVNYSCTESLGDKEGPSESFTYSLTLGVGGDGVPDAIPVPAFLSDSSDRVVLATVGVVGESETYEVPFAGIHFDMTVTVLSAEYGPQSATVVLDVDVAWFGEQSSMTARGTHTLHIEAVADGLALSSETHYDAEFQADNWGSPGTRDFVGQGTLSPQ